MEARHELAPDLVELVNRVDEVDMEPSSTGQRVTTWVVVADSKIYVRSYRGSRGKWYQALLQQPTGVLHAEDRRIPFRAELVTDAAMIARVSEAFQDKYGRKWPGETAAMLVDEVLPTTLRLDPTG